MTTSFKGMISKLGALATMLSWSIELILAFGTNFVFMDLISLSSALLVVVGVLFERQLGLRQGCVAEQTRFIHWI